jgi:hypothetical protein
MKECPICKSQKRLNPNHIKKCFGKDIDYKFKYIIHNRPQINFKDVHNLYVNKKWSIPMMCEKYDLDIKSICYLLNYFKIHIRSIKETRHLNEYKERIEKTNMEKFGAINPLSKGTVPYYNRNQTVLDKYGCENVFQRLELFISDWSNLGKHSKISSLNKILYSVLDELHINYKPEHSISYTDESGKKRWKSYDAKVGNLLIEVNGDYWHANPVKYKDDDIFQFPKSRLTAKDIWNLDIYKKKIAEQYGYELMTVWESEIKENINDVKQRIKNKVHQKSKI